MSRLKVLLISVAVLIPGIALDAGEDLEAASGYLSSSPEGGPSYTLVRATTASGALRMTSASYSATSALGQRSPTGGASFCNTGARTTAGFWSLSGHAHVPVVLTGQRSSADPTSGLLRLDARGADLLGLRHFGIHPSGGLTPGRRRGRDSARGASRRLRIPASWRRFWADLA